MRIPYAGPGQHSPAKFVDGVRNLLSRWLQVAACAVVSVAATATTVSAETLLMPNRDMLAGASEVVWGITTLPNGSSTYRINYGDGGGFSAATPVVDRSYIALNRTYALQGPYTITLEVTNGATVETATTAVVVYNGALLSAFELRELNVNRAIQNGLRSLWQSQNNRTTFDTTIETSWPWFPSGHGDTTIASAALGVLAVQNQGFQLSNNNNAPTGLYQKYLVRRGINYVLARLTTLNITALTPAGNDACTIYGPPPCIALFGANTAGADAGYINGIALLSLAGSGAMNRTNVEVTSANVVNRTYGEILQRMVNASLWGQNDVGTGRGGWIYSFNGNSSDGSTNGWQLLGLLDAEAAGMTVPAWVRTEFARALAAGLNNDGSYDYMADNSRANNSSVNVAKTGVGVQGMFFTGRLATDPDLALAKTWIGARWANQALGQQFVCSGPAGLTYNKGCAYGMYNVFKGFRLFGIPTLAGVNRPAGPGSIPSDDWYADYVDWLLANQFGPTTPTGGHWQNMTFSSQTTLLAAQTSLALLMLSPTALVLPDPVQFGAVGLQHGTPLTTDPRTNPVTNPPGTHTVTGITVATNGSPIPGVTVQFRVLTGPNAGASGSGNSGANGQTTFTYTGTGGAGQDRIQANVGALLSNVLIKNWVAAGLTCDINNDGRVTPADVLLIRGRLNSAATSLTDPFDSNRDGVVNVADMRFCQLRQTAATP